MRVRVAAAAVAAGAGLLSCRESSPTPAAPNGVAPGGSATVRQVIVAPATATLAQGDSTQLTAAATGAGDQLVPGVSFTWSSSDSTVARVTRAGLVSVRAVGHAMITAATAGVTGSSSITVRDTTPAPPPPPATPPTTPPPPAPAILVGAGDIASCASSGDEATAALLDSIPGTVFALGDNVYMEGTPSEFADCYAPSWGRHKGRTRPTPGNHEYRTPNAAGYYAYFGAAAGDPAKGYYSYDLNGWHVVVLNSNCGAVGGCGAGSPQEQWLRADLAAHPAACTLAYWHHPRFNSGASHGNNTSVQPLWEALFDANAELVLNGHEHVYERFAPQTPSGAADAARGIRQFTVGTGGVGHYQLGTRQPNSELFEASADGVLKLTLGSGSYGWEFIPVAGQTFRDSGTGTCH